MIEAAWEWRRRQGYGTLICDLESRRFVHRLPDREGRTSEAWLKRRTGITVEKSRSERAL
jgi:hypothetical protein